MATLNSLDLVQFLNGLKERMPESSQRDKAYNIFKTWCSQKGVRRTLLINSMFNRYYPSKTFKRRVVRTKVREYLLQNYEVDQIINLVENEVCPTYTLKFNQKLVEYIQVICDESSDEYVLSDITSMEQGALHVLRCGGPDRDEVEPVHGRAPKTGYKKPRYCCMCDKPLTAFDWPNHCLCSACTGIANRREDFEGIGTLAPHVRIPEPEEIPPPYSNFYRSTYYKYKYLSKSRS